MKKSTCVTIKCQVCGREKIVFPSEAHRAFCSRACANKGRRIREKGEFDHSLTWEKTTDEKWLCPYQVNVGCFKRECNRCGWNPEVAKVRNEAIKERMAQNGQIL